MKIICISDTHNYHKTIKLPEGDIIVHTGDFSSRGYNHELEDFTKWYGSLKYKHKVLIAGNHDIGTEKKELEFKKMCTDNDIIYLNDSGISLEGIMFWGSPVTPRFGNGWAWNRDIENLIPPRGTVYNPIKDHWDRIPDNVDVLLTHGPPKGVLDFTYYDQKHVGCPILLDKVLDIAPKLHIFGHIHECQGMDQIGDTVFVNASICTLQYKPTNKPIVVEIDNEKI